MTREEQIRNLQKHICPSCDLTDEERAERNGWNAALDAVLALRASSGVVTPEEALVALVLERQAAVTKNGSTAAEVAEAAAADDALLAWRPSGVQDVATFMMNEQPAPPVAETPMPAIQVGDDVLVPTHRYVRTEDEAKKTDWSQALEVHRVLSDNKLHIIWWRQRP